MDRPATSIVGIRFESPKAVLGQKWRLSHRGHYLAIDADSFRLISG